MRLMEISEGAELLIFFCKTLNRYLTIFNDSEFNIWDDIE